MALVDIAIVAGLIGLIALLIHAANVLSANPYQQIKAQEDLAGRFPSGMTVAQKLDLIDRWGISPTTPRRLWLLIASLCGVLILLVWQR
jgi:hypothetical protein